MNQYFEQLNPIIKEYFHILSPEIPPFLEEYINTPEMQRIGKISMSCGIDYTKIFHNQFFYSNLEHSVGVALIIWHFTKDKKQTLAGLFHDIATPCFKHCIDFMNGDHEKQESTEELTTQIIQNSKEITQLLKRDGIKLEEVNDYHIYPIADNDTPKLSADRFEYTFSCGLVQKVVWNLDKIKEMYENITILENEEGIPELGFQDAKLAEEYITIIRELWPSWFNNEDRITMQFIADTMKKMSEEGYITVDDLYHLSEAEVINKIENCENKYIAEAFKKFRNTTKIGESDVPVENKYCISVKAKRRYIVPLTKTTEGNIVRINQVSELAKEKIDSFLSFEVKPYAYFDFDFK